MTSTNPSLGQSVCRLIGGPFEGAEVLRGSNSLLLSGEGVPDGQVARYRWLDADQAYVFMGLDTIVAQIPMPSKMGQSVCRPEPWMVVRQDAKLPGGWRVVHVGMSEPLARKVAAERAGHEAMATSHLYELRMEAMRDAQT